MTFTDRIRVEACGCHYDAGSGLVTAYCWHHDPDRRGTVRAVAPPYDWARDDDWAEP